MELLDPPGLACVRQPPVLCNRAPHAERENGGVSWVFSICGASVGFLTRYDPTDCSPPGSSVHGIFHARVLEWGAILPLVLGVNSLLEPVLSAPLISRKACAPSVSVPHRASETCLGHQSRPQPPGAFWRGL